MTYTTQLFIEIAQVWRDYFDKDWPEVKRDRLLAPLRRELAAQPFRNQQK